MENNKIVELIKANNEFKKELDQGNIMYQYAGAIKSKYGVDLLEVYKDEITILEKRKFRSERFARNSYYGSGINLSHIDYLSPHFNNDIIKKAESGLRKHAVDFDFQSLYYVSPILLPSDVDKFIQFQDVTIWGNIPIRYSSVIDVYEDDISKYATKEYVTPWGLIDAPITAIREKLKHLPNTRDYLMSDLPLLESLLEYKYADVDLSAACVYLPRYDRYTKEEI